MLSSSFSVSGAVKTSMDSIRTILNSLPNLKMLSAGTRLKYAVLLRSGEAPADSRGRPANPIFEISPNTAKLTFYFDVPERAQRPTNMIRMLALLAILSGEYEPSLPSMYQDLIESLESVPFGHFGDPRHEFLETEIRALSEANCRISDSYLGAKRALGSLEKLCLEYRSFCSPIIKSVGRDCRDDEEVLLKLGHFGVGRATAESIKRDIKVWEGPGAKSSAGKPGASHVWG